MDVDDHHGDPAFPRELECIIFQMALENSMMDAKNLIFISKNAFDWCALFPGTKNLDNSFSLEASSLSYLKQLS